MAGAGHSRVHGRASPRRPGHRGAERADPHPPPTPRGRPQGAGRPARRAARSASLGPVGSLRGGFRPHGPHVDPAGCREGHKETLSTRLRAVGRPSSATAPPPGHGENLAWTLRGPDPDPGARGRLTLTGARGRGGRDSGSSETRPSSRWTPPTETECGVSQSLGAALSPRGLRAPPCASSTSLPPRNADCPLPSRQLTLLRPSPWRPRLRPRPAALFVSTGFHYPTWQAGLILGS